VVKHPAKYTDVLLPVFESILNAYKCKLVLDPFAGTGKIHSLPFETVGVEIEPEWAKLNKKTICADATYLPFNTYTFDAVCTSPTYGNRMADHHNAKDNSKRLTYTHVLGRQLHKNNTGKMQWGEQYRSVHLKAWQEVNRVLKPSGIFILNVSDHIRKGEVQLVTDFHIKSILNEGFDLIEHQKIVTPRLGFGQNRTKRVNYESIITFKKRKQAST
jgi:tRNA G10  N-methylase Trm11